MKLPIIVQKYGGSSLSSINAIKNIARQIKARKELGFNICVIVSAMGDSTNKLLEKAKEISNSPSARELDMLLTTGERTSMSLLAMALESIDVPSISFTGSQSGIITDENHSDAKILEIKPNRVLRNLDNNKVVIVAGFQGVSKINKEITSLGRGGSDTSAVCLAAALKAEACEIYSDVSGVYSADPHMVHDAKRIEQISYEEMRALSHAGAQVLHEQAVVEAEKHGVTIHALKSHSKNLDRDHSGTFICSNSHKAIRAVALKENGEVFELESLGELENFSKHNLEIISADLINKKILVASWGSLINKNIKKISKISLIQKGLSEHNDLIKELFVFLDNPNIYAVKILENSAAIYVKHAHGVKLQQAIHKKFV